MLFLTPHFDHLKTTGHVRNHVFSSEEGLKAFFSMQPPPRGSCFAIIRVSLIYKGGRKHWECLNF